MSLEQVAESVVEKGRREAGKIVKEGGKEVLRILSEADKKSAEHREKQLAAAKKAAGELRVKELSAMEMQSRRRRLNTEREIFESVRRKALSDMQAASRPRKDAILRHLMAKASREMPSGRIYCNAMDAEFVKGQAGSLSFGGTIDCIGGVIVESADGSQRFDMTYETLFVEVWEKQLAEIHKIVFQG